MDVRTITKGHSHVSLWGLLRPTLQLLDWAALIKTVTQHQHERQHFTSHSHVFAPTPHPITFSCRSAPHFLCHNTLLTPTTTTITTTSPPALLSRVWQSHSWPCVCWRRYIMPSFHCTLDQREQSSTEKLLLADISSLQPLLCFFRLLYSTLQYNQLQDSSRLGNTLTEIT